MLVCVVGKQWTHRESNPNYTLRRGMSYPLNDGFTIGRSVVFSLRIYYVTYNNTKVRLLSYIWILSDFISCRYTWILYLAKNLINHHRCWIYFTHHPNFSFYLFFRRWSYQKYCPVLSHIQQISYCNLLFLEWLIWVQLHTQTSLPKELWIW